MHGGNEQASNPEVLSSTLATGASELVVQEAMERTWCRTAS